MKFTKDYMNEHNMKVYHNNPNIEVLSLIEGTNKRILDIGCGAGNNAMYLKQFNHVIDGITLSELEKKIAAQYMNNIFIFNLEDGLPNIDCYYDYILCSHVLEHIAYPQKLMSDIKKYLKEDGKLIVAVPNLFHYKSRIQLLNGNFPQHESGIWDKTHLRWFNNENAQDLLISNGFGIIDKKYSGEIPLLTLFGLLPTSIRKKMFSFLLKVSKGLFTSQWIYVAK